MLTKLKNHTFVGNIFFMAIKFSLLEISHVFLCISLVTVSYLLPLPKHLELLNFHLFSDILKTLYLLDETNSIALRNTILKIILKKLILTKIILLFIG